MPARKQANPVAISRPDDENPEWTREDFAKARQGAEALPPEILAAFGKKRGRPKAIAPKVALKLRIDPDVVDAYKATGSGWQTRMNDTLRRGMDDIGKLSANKRA